MNYAFEDKLVTYVTGADSIEEFEQLIAKIDAMDGTTLNMKGVVSADQAGMMEMLTEDVFSGLTKAPLVITHTSNQDLRTAFYAEFGVTIHKRNAAIRKQNEMLAELVEDPYSPEATDTRTIEEIHGLVKHDPYDKRSEEEIAADEEKKKLWDAAKKSGDLSGDSWGPGRQKDKDPQTQITDIKTSIGADGRIQIDSAIGVKGLYDKPKVASSRSLDDILAGVTGGDQTALDAAKAAVVEDQNGGPDSEDVTVDPEGMVAIFYKIDIADKKLSDLRGVVAGQFDLDLAVVQRNSPTGCWVAFARQIQAEELETLLTGYGFAVSRYAVSDIGERLVPEGVEVVDVSQPKAEKPRPWNWMASKITTMTEEERKENEGSISTSEFIFCGNYEGADQGTIIYIAPRSYFSEKGEMWPEPLNIEPILPRDFVEIKPGIYRSMSRDWNHISFDLASRGMKENLSLQIYLNSL